MKRVVLDTNVTISAFFWKGHPRTVYNLIRERKIIMLVSSNMEHELIRVLGYSKLGLSPKEALPFIKNLRNNVEHIETSSKISAITADHTDNIFLDCAVDGMADYIISGDKHLLDLGIYNGIQILKAKDFLVKEGYLTV
mgnify:CR=1 FL=1